MALADKLLTGPGGHTAWDYAHSILTKLHEIQEAVQAGHGDSPLLRRLQFNVRTDLNGAGQAEFILPAGKTWSLTGIGFHGDDGGGYLAVYANEEQGTGLLKVIPVAAFVSDDFGDDCEVNQDENRILIVVRNVAPGVTISGNIRLSQYDNNPNAPKDAVA